MKTYRIIFLITFLLALPWVLRVVIPTFSIVTLTSVFISIVCFILGFIIRKTIREGNIQKRKLVLLFFYYNLFILVYSCFVANSYEQWRYLFTVFFPFIFTTFFMFMGGNLKATKTIFKTLIFTGIPLSFLLYFSDVRGANDFTHYISFIYLLLLMVPYLSNIWKAILITISIISILFDIDLRSNIMNFAFIGVILLIFYLSPKGLSKFFFINVRKLLLFAPILFFLLGTTGVFNIYKFGDYYKELFSVEYANQRTSLSQDTRTGIYIDALNAIQEKDAYLFGISAAGTYNTHLKEVDEYFDNLKMGRMGNEVGILEYLLRGGILYVILVFLLHYYSSQLALMQSNNTLCKLFGVFIAYRWFFLFVEGQPSLNLQNISIFLIMGLCLNPLFRKLNDGQIKMYVNSFFTL